MSQIERVILITIAVLLVALSLYQSWHIQAQWEWIQHLQATNEAQDRRLSVHNEALRLTQENFDMVTEWQDAALKWMWKATFKIEKLEELVTGDPMYVPEPDPPAVQPQQFDGSYAVYY